MIIYEKFCSPLDVCVIGIPGMTDVRLISSFSLSTNFLSISTTWKFSISYNLFLRSCQYFKLVIAKVTLQGKIKPKAISRLLLTAYSKSQTQTKVEIHFCSTHKTSRSRFSRHVSVAPHGPWNQDMGLCQQGKNVKVSRPKSDKCLIRCLLQRSTGTENDFPTSYDLDYLDDIQSRLFVTSTLVNKRQMIEELPLSTWVQTMPREVHS